MIEDANSDKLELKNAETSFNKTSPKTQVVVKYKIPLLPGEKLMGDPIKDITYFGNYSEPITGKLYITNYKIYFMQNIKSEKNLPIIINVPLCTVSLVEKAGQVNNGPRQTVTKNPYGVNIACKDLRNIRFGFVLKQDSQQRRAIYDKLQELCFPMSLKQPVFAFSYKEEYNEELSGWSLYKAHDEYTRLGLPLEGWRLTKANKKYELCETYPDLLAVPSAASDDDLSKVAQFRSSDRLPALCWIHPESNATITRCSQPLVGMGNKRSREDERYLHLILEANPHAHKLLIYDARPPANARANIARGGGYEKSEAYTISELVFCNIHNIHVMRESLRKLQETCHGSNFSDKHFLANLEQTQWLHHVKLVLAAATRIADRVESGKASVLVHCSDGWDRTSQLTSLSMIMLDSYYRTLNGFMVLIEKEWLSFGHKFAHRIGHGHKGHGDTERSPIFLQFIDCVWQIYRQFRTAFEFNEKFLIFILDHLYSCLFGTFLCNCERERKEVKKKTKSLWSHVLTHREDYLNALYASAYQNHVILPIAALRHLELWTSYYARWNPLSKSQESIDERHKQLLKTRDSMIRKVQELEKQLAAKKLSVSSSPPDPVANKPSS